MITKAVRLYGVNDLRLDTFELPALKPDEILAEVITDSVCMSTYKGVIQGAHHKRIPEDIAENPIVIGHEFAGRIVAVGPEAAGGFQPGDRFTIQPNINHKGIGYAPGYSFPCFGGDATYIVIPGEVMQKGFLLPYKGDAFFKASLTEPISCIYAAYAAAYHTERNGKQHVMGLKDGGKMAILAGCGPMGLGAVDIAINLPQGPSLIVVTDIDEGRLARAESILTPAYAKAAGKTLVYLNTAAVADPVAALREASGGSGFDDILVMAPVSAVVEQADAAAGKDCCINFFSGPTDAAFSANVNFYDVHYAAKHIMGTSGGDTEDMVESIHLIETTPLNPAAMVTHIGGLNCVAETVPHLPALRAGKILIYVGLQLPLTAIKDFAELGKENPLFCELHKLCSRTNMLWNPEAEAYLLAHADAI